VTTSTRHETKGGNASQHFEFSSRAALLTSRPSASMVQRLVAAKTRSVDDGGRQWTGMSLVLCATRSRPRARGGKVVRVRLSSRCRRLPRPSEISMPITTSSGGKWRTPDLTPTSLLPLRRVCRPPTWPRPPLHTPQPTEASASPHRPPPRQRHATPLADALHSSVHGPLLVLPRWAAPLRVRCASHNPAALIQALSTDCSPANMRALPCSTRTRRTCSTTRTSPTTAPAARTTPRSRIQRSCVASARPWSASALRRPSE
jgi:hypothetical protein